MAGLGRVIHDLEGRQPDPEDVDPRAKPGDDGVKRGGRIDEQLGRSHEPPFPSGARETI